MSFDWQQLVEIARQLAQQADKEPTQAEALRRAAISRAYYGAFCHARNYAVDYLGYSVKGFGDDHGALRAHLRRKRRGGDAQRLDDLRQWRNDADYADELPWDSEEVAAEAIREAEKVFKSLAPPTT